MALSKSFLEYLTDEMDTIIHSYELLKQLKT